MNRRKGAKKQARPKTTRRARAAKSGSVAQPAAMVLDNAGAEYVGKLASAIADVTAAQERWLADIDSASQTPGMMRDMEWQAHSQAAVRSLLVAANRLRIEPVPAALAVVDETLQKAQDEAQLATEGYLAALDQISAASMLAAVQHVDQMGQFIQQAYALVRGGEA